MEIDKDVPAILIGDSSRIKQILINIVGNAIKFTQTGMIKVSVSSVYKENQFYLQFKVADTGIGIKKQNLSKLFISFNQIDNHYNLNHEGTGLGLAISKSLCELMNGEISVESEFGVGSVFTFMVMQKVQNDKTLIQPVAQKNRKLCILEPSSLLRDFYSETLKQFDVSYCICENLKEFIDRIQEQSFDYVFVDQSFKKETLLPYIKDAKVITILKQQETTLFSNLHDEYKIYCPMFSLQLSYLLSNQSKVYMEEQLDAIPSLLNTRVLVVDDNQINREIAQEIIAFYDIESDGAASGQEAIDMVKLKEYDLVFMDHMMPDMDGIEAMQAIRMLPEKRYQSLPIIALTANATENAKQMFLQLGFDGFLSKPIDIKKLNGILEKWLRPLHDERTNQ